MRNGARDIDGRPLYDIMVCLQTIAPDSKEGTVKCALIVVGGGLGDLMAAKTAAEDGLKVVLIKRKRDITKINQTCCQKLRQKQFLKEP